MRIRLAALAVALGSVLAGCASVSAPSARHSNPAAGIITSAPVAPATSVPPTVPGPRVRICREFRGMLPPLVRALSHRDSRILFRDGGKLARWSYTATFTAHDAQFANYLTDAGTQVSLVASPIGAEYELKYMRETRNAAMILACSAPR
jgi:hypothetical protein